MSELPAATDELIRLARTVAGIPPDQYQVAFRSIAELLERRAAETPAKPYLIFYDDDNKTREEYTYARFNRRVNQVANLLAKDLGVGRGDRVATVAYNHPDTVIAYFACWKIGATVAPQNVAEDDSRIAFILANAGCRVALVRPEYRERVEHLRHAAPELQQIVTMDAAYHAAVDLQPEEWTAPDEFMLEDECLLVYTSGTTGAPKGVQLIQYNMLADARGICDWQHVTSDQRWMCILPIHHVNGTIVTLVTPMYIGGSVVLNRAFKASTFWQRIAAEQVHIVSVVPTILQFLSEANADISALDLDRLRYLICGAGTLAIAVARRFETTFGVRVLHGYGLSETTCYSCFLPTDLSAEEHRHWLEDHGYPSIGVPITANEMAIHDGAGQELPDGERGEIVIRGHNVMIGYFQRPDANAETFKYGWFRSGDEGFVRRDALGRPFFFISGRLKELINRGGVKYSPFEIEEVLLAIPGVKLGLAVAFPNTWYGEEVGAFVVREAGSDLSEADVLDHCRRRMPFAKAPKVVVFGHEAPVTTTGKYQRLRLQDLFSAWSETQFKG